MVGNQGGAGESRRLCSGALLPIMPILSEADRSLPRFGRAGSTRPPSYQTWPAAFAGRARDPQPCESLQPDLLAASSCPLLLAGRSCHCLEGIAQDRRFGATSSLRNFSASSDVCCFRAGWKQGQTSVAALCSVRGATGLATAPQPGRTNGCLLQQNVVEAEPLPFYDCGKRPVAFCVRLATEEP